MEENNKKFFGNIFMEPKSDEPVEVSGKEPFEKIPDVSTPPANDATGDDFPTAKIETEKTVEKVPEDKKEIPKTEESDSSDFFFESYINELAQEGAITEEEIEEQGFDNTPEGVKAFIAYEKKRAAEQAQQAFIDELPEDAKRVIELAKEGVDIRSILEFESEEVDYHSMLENVEDQQNLYFNHLLETGLSEERAIKKVKASLESGDLEDDAKEAAEFLSKKQNAEKEQLINQQKAAAKQEQERQKEEYVKFEKEILSTTQIKGFDINKQTATKLLEFMVKPDPKTGKTAEQIAWEDPETRKAVSYFLMNKFDFKALEKKAESKATIKLKTKVNNITDKNTSSKGTKILDDEKPATTALLPKFNLLF
jgi:hypothetical protein